MGLTSNRRGQTLIAFLLAFPLLIGALGLTVDLGWSYFRQQAAKSAAQAAALAATTAAGSLSTGNPSCGNNNVVCQSFTACPGTIANPAVTNIDVACQYAKDNGFANASGGIQNVMVASGTGTPTGLSGVSVPYWVQVTTAENIAQTFSAVFGSSLGTVSARSTSGYLKAGACLYVLGSPGTTLSMVGNATINSVCGIYVDSTSASAIDLKGGGSITTTGGATVNVVGGVSGKPSNISPAANTSATAVADPLSGLVAPSSSGCSIASTGGTQTLSPCTSGGVVTITNGISLTSQSTVTLNPGVYILDGGISLGGQSTLVATGGVTLYIPTGSISIAGGATMTVTAPTSGTYKGIGIFQPSSNTSAISLVGGSGQIINGAIYAPAAAISYTGGSGTNAGRSMIVCNSISFKGASNLGQPLSNSYSGSLGATLIE